MPTEPIQGFVSRKIDDPNLEKLLNQFSEFIREIVNYSSHVNDWMLKKVRGGDENIPLFLSYRHIFELIDSISLMVKESYIDPCKILLRSIFESVLNVEYILEKNSNQRSMDFLVWFIYQRLDRYKRLDPSTTLGKEYQNRLKSDKLLFNFETPEIPKLQDAINNLESLLKKPRYSPSEEEFQRSKRRKKKKGPKPRNWFSLHGGPMNIMELAKSMGFQGFYDILYRNWSGYVHGLDVYMGRVSKVEDGKTEIWAIKSPKDAESVTLFTASFALHTIRICCKHFVPEKITEMANWYKDEIRDLYLKLPLVEIEVK